MPNPNFKPIWLPLPVHARLERLQRRMMGLLVEKGRDPDLAMHRVVVAALKLSEIERKVGLDEPED